MADPSEPDDDNVMHDSPAEVAGLMAATPGQCTAQSVLPAGDVFLCHCTCGTWDVTAPTQEEGLALAEAHTLATIGL